MGWPPDFDGEDDEEVDVDLAAHKSASSADNPRWHEAMKGPNADGFLRASTLEIATLQEMDAWTQVPMTKNMNVKETVPA